MMPRPARHSKSLILLLGILVHVSASAIPDAFADPTASEILGLKPNATEYEIRAALDRGLLALTETAVGLGVNLREWRTLRGATGEVAIELNRQKWALLSAAGALLPGERDIWYRSTLGHSPESSGKVLLFVSRGPQYIPNWSADLNASLAGAEVGSPAFDESVRRAFGASWTVGDRLAGVRMNFSESVLSPRVLVGVVKEVGRGVGLSAERILEKLVANEVAAIVTTKASFEANMKLAAKILSVARELAPGREVVILRKLRLKVKLLTFAERFIESGYVAGGFVAELSVRVKELETRHPESTDGASERRTWLGECFGWFRRP